MKHKAVLDVETGGYNPDKNAICEVGLLVTDQYLKITDQYSQIVKPHFRPNSIELRSYKPDAMKVHGITMEEIENGVISSTVACEVAEIFLGNDIFQVIGHNVKFDIKFIQNLLQQHGFQIQMKPICTMELAKQYAKKFSLKFENYKLPTLLRHFNIENDAEHRALTDAKATLELYKQLNITVTGLMAQMLRENPHWSSENDGFIMNPKMHKAYLSEQPEHYDQFNGFEIMVTESMPHMNIHVTSKSDPGIPAPEGTTLIRKV